MTFLGTLSCDYFQGGSKRGFNFPTQSLCRTHSERQCTFPTAEIISPQAMFEV